MGKRIGLGREHGGGVYMLVRDDIPSGLASVATNAELSLLWHCPFGHPSHKNLQLCLPWIKVESFVCESCHLGKHHRATYRRFRLSSN